MASPVAGPLALDTLSSQVFLLNLVLTALLLPAALASRSPFHHLACLLAFLGATLATVSVTLLPLLFIAWETTALFLWGLRRLAEEDDHPPYTSVGAAGSFLFLLALTGRAIEGQTLQIVPLAADRAVLLALGVLLGGTLKTLSLLAETTPGPCRGPEVGRALAASGGGLVLLLYPSLRLNILGLASREERERLLVLALALAIGLAGLALVRATPRACLTALTIGQLVALTAAGSLEALARPETTIWLVTWSGASAGGFLTLGLAVPMVGPSASVPLRGLALRAPGLGIVWGILGLALVGLPPASGLAVWVMGRWPALPWPGAWAAVLALEGLGIARLSWPLFQGGLRPPQRSVALPDYLGLVGPVGLVLALGLAGQRIAGWLLVVGQSGRF